MRRLADGCHIHKVIKELEEADRPVGDRVAVGAGRAPEPTLELRDGLARHDVRVATQRRQPLAAWRSIGAWRP